MASCCCVLGLVLDSGGTGDLMKLLFEKDVSDPTTVPGFQMRGAGNKKIS